MQNIFASNSTKEVWTKEITADDKVIILTMYCWVVTLVDIICITIIPQKG